MEIGEAIAKFDASLKDKDENYVHEDVAKVLMKQNFQHLVLTPVEESRD